MASEENKPYKRGWQFPRLTPKQAVTKMMEPTNASNGKFLQSMILEGNISEEALSSSPPGVIEIATDAARGGSTPLGTGSNPQKTFKANAKLPSFIPHQDEYPDHHGSRGRYGKAADSKLTRDISMGAFMGGNALGMIPSDIDRGHLALNLHMQAEVLKAARSRPEFQGFHIDVAEGVYRYEKLEKKTADSMADLSSKGRAIGYRVADFEGNDQPRKLFELAQYIKSYPFYEKVIMDYNSYAGETIARMFVVVPDMSGNASTTSFSRSTETHFNGKTISGSLMLLDVFPPDNDDESV